TRHRFEFYEQTCADSAPGIVRRHIDPIDNARPDIELREPAHTFLRLLDKNELVGVWWLIRVRALVAMPSTNLLFRVVSCSELANCRHANAKDRLSILPHSAADHGE